MAKEKKKDHIPFQRKTWNNEIEHVIGRICAVKLKEYFRRKFFAYISHKKIQRDVMFARVLGRLRKIKRI